MSGVGFGAAGFAPAKLNLYLHVTGRRPDGYHLLDSLAVFADVGDRLRAAPADRLTLAVDGPFGAGLAAGADNLVLRAARAISPKHAAALVLEKNLPVASGIGGGSADAAAALRLLPDLWGVAVPAGAAAALGADVPVCVGRAPARMLGVGEILEPAPRLPPQLGVVLVNPGVAVATPAVFKARKGGFSAPARLPEAWEDAAALARDLAELRNDLQAPAIALAPVIGTVLAALDDLRGALLARMSGSGATCFALFASTAAARDAAVAVQQPGWWCWGGGLYAAGAPDL